MLNNAKKNITRNDGIQYAIQLSRKNLLKSHYMANHIYFNAKSLLPMLQSVPPNSPWPGMMLC